MTGTAPIAEEINKTFVGKPSPSWVEDMDEESGLYLLQLYGRPGHRHKGLFLQRKTSARRFRGGGYRKFLGTTLWAHQRIKGAADEHAQ